MPFVSCGGWVAARGWCCWEVDETAVWRGDRVTCIVGIENAGRVYIGGDSAGVAGLSIQTRRDPKVFAVGELIIGYTSSFRMGQLLRFNLSVPPRIEREDDDFEWMVKRLVPEIRETLKEGGYATVNNGEESGGVFLVGYRGSLYEIESDFQVAMPADGYAAVGCGSDIALGSLHGSKRLDPIKRIERALSASEHHSAGVRGPFVIKETT